MEAMNDMAKCDCWYEVKGRWGSDYTGVCNGTKDTEYCKCNGDNTKCDFYPEKRKESKTMKTLEMMNTAKADGKTYKHINNDMFYNDKYGFINSNGNYITMDNFAYTLTINAILAFDWEETNNIMTLDEAEEKYGIKIIG